MTISADIDVDIINARGGNHHGASGGDNGAIRGGGLAVADEQVPMRRTWRDPDADPGFFFGICSHFESLFF